VKRLAVTFAALAAVCAPFAAGAAERSWAQPEIDLVTKRGVFAATPATFRPDDPITAGTLARVVAR